MPEERISPAVVIVGGLGLGVAAAVGIAAMAMAAPPEEGIELQPGGNTVKWTGGPTHVEDALADIIDYVTLFLVLRETDQEWIQITADIWDTWAIPRDQICGIYVDRACTVTGFVWAAPPGEIYCPYCGAGPFATLDEVNEHIAAEHPGQPLIIHIEWE